MLEGGFQLVFGAEKSWYCRSSFVMVKHTNSEEVSLASKVLFTECTCNYVEVNTRQSTLWVAAVSWYYSHPAKVWFGKPTQVWSSSAKLGYSFIPIPIIKSRVVFAKATIDIGKMNGHDNVYVIVPLYL